MSPSSGHNCTQHPNNPNWSKVMGTDFLHILLKKNHFTRENGNTYQGNVGVKIGKGAHLFDRYGPSTAYAVCFTVNALCLLTGFP